MKSSKLWEKFSILRKWDDKLFDGAEVETDDASSAVNIAILLKNEQRYEEAVGILTKLHVAFPLYAPGSFELSLNNRYLGRPNTALQWAKQTYRLSRDEIYARNLIVQLVLCNKYDEALYLLDEREFSDIRSAQEDNIYFDFIRFVRKYPLRLAQNAIQEASEAGVIIDVNEVEKRINRAMTEQRPFSIIRLGDGEGAWTFLSRLDECEFKSIYSYCRLSFLNDWFGSEDANTNNNFYRFARDLSPIIDAADIVGVTDRPRIDHEFRLGSIRGIPASINVLRATGIIDGQVDTNRKYCSNNVHFELESAGFFERLFSTGASIGLISSQVDLPTYLMKNGASLKYQFATPGDSRNFWIDKSTGSPFQQFPEVFTHISAKIRSMDLRGVVFLVAAGFVGKQYSAVIKSSGGVCIDIGGIADHWMKIWRNKPRL